MVIGAFCVALPIGSRTGSGALLLCSLSSLVGTAAQICLIASSKQTHEAQVPGRAGSMLGDGRGLVIRADGLASVLGSKAWICAPPRGSSVAGSEARSVIAYHVSGKHLESYNWASRSSPVRLTGNLLIDGRRLVIGGDGVASLAGIIPGSGGLAQD